MKERKKEGGEARPRVAALLKPWKGVVTNGGASSPKRRGKRWARKVRGEGERAAGPTLRRASLVLGGFGWVGEKGDGGRGGFLSEDTGANSFIIPGEEKKKDGRGEMTKKHLRNKQEKRNLLESPPQDQWLGEGQIRKGNIRGKKASLKGKSDL